VAPAADIATASTSWVTVVDPAPGGGASNMAFVTVTDNRASLVVFSLTSSLPVGSYPNSVTASHFKADGKLDVTVANVGSNTVSILLGDGTGNFTLAQSLASGAGPNSVAVGDFNGDGKVDLAVVNGYDNTVSEGGVHVTVAHMERCSASQPVIPC
jgi:hypothetical protein